MSDHPRTPLANLPTPLEPYDELSRELGITLCVKRDDLTGCALSGNKVRKLEWLVGDAQARGADTLVTCGAVTSNHARATAVAAARVGMRSHLLLRGEEGTPDGNLLLDRLFGAGTTFIDSEAWPDRDAIMDEIADRLRAQGRSPHVIPEGGSNAIGSVGYALAAAEIAEQVDALGQGPLRAVLHATGSGGTTAGLSLGFAMAGREDVEVVGVAVCNDRAYFDEVVRRIHVASDVGAVADRARWTILEGYKGRGYALTTPEEMAFYADIARRTGLVLDPVYTGKAFRALVEEARQGRLPTDGITVFLHTGGIFGLFSFAEEILALNDRGTAPRED